jgi:hypothetical protein
MAAMAAVAVAFPARLIAASPTPTQVGAGDPRSSGQGPGLVGDPLLALLVVAAIASSRGRHARRIRLTGGPDRCG